MRENLALARVARAILAQRSPQTRLFQTLFDRQQAFISDPAEFAVACCSRQAGKTRSCATAMIMKANEAPERNVAYVALTRKSAKLICWRTLKSLCKQFKVDAEFNESELIVNFGNGSIIQLTGANDSAVGETLRGLPWDLAIVDEAASFRGHIQDVIEECIAPAFITRHGKLKLIGTPSSDFQSYFYKAFHSLPDYSRHHWTVRNNPHIPHADEYLAKLLVRKGWDLTNPTYLREYEGKWARSTDNLVYHAYNPLKNQCTMEAVPQGLMTVMGVGNHMGREMFPRALVHGPAGRWLITATHHEAHHAAYRGNYGLYFRFWDKICGTDIGLGTFAAAHRRRKPAAADG